MFWLFWLFWFVKFSWRQGTFWSICFPHQPAFQLSSFAKLNLLGSRIFYCFTPNICYEAKKCSTKTWNVVKANRICHFFLLPENWIAFQGIQGNIWILNATPVAFVCSRCIVVVLVAFPLCSVILSFGVIKDMETNP